MDSLEFWDDLGPIDKLADMTSSNDELMNILKNTSMEDLIGLNETYSLGNSSFDYLYETLHPSGMDALFPNDSDLMYSPFKLSTKGDKETTLFEFTIVGVMLTGISIFGLVGNMVAIVVLSSPVMKGSFSSLLIGE